MHLLLAHQRKSKIATRNAVTIAFTNLELLIPIEAVIKIIPAPEVRISAQKVLGLAEIDQQQIIALDLHYPLYGSNQNTGTGYLILLRHSSGLQYGVATASLPMIQVIEVDRIEPWTGQDGTNIEPDQVAILQQIVSHQTTSQSKTAKIPGFWLDTDRLIQAVRQWAAA